MEKLDFYHESFQKLEELTCLRLNSEVVGAHVCVAHISKLMRNVCLQFFLLFAYNDHTGDLIITTLENTECSIL